ncbi:MAG: hypothetical protein RIQ53_2539 [Pseudomonadota bacterium]|jgi:predicted Zn finger-like uncharacterized protein
MMLATRCSHCATVFRVVPDQLRVSNGLVRCGRCDAVFDATATLFDIERGHPVVLDELSPTWLEQAVPVGPGDPRLAGDTAAGAVPATSTASIASPASRTAPPARSGLPAPETDDRATPAAGQTPANPSATPPMYRRSTDPRPPAPPAPPAPSAPPVAAAPPPEAPETPGPVPGQQDLATPDSASARPDAPTPVVARAAASPTAAGTAAAAAPASPEPAPDIDWNAHLRERQRRAAAADFGVDSTMERPGPEFYGTAATAHDPEIARLLRQAAAVDEDTRPASDTLDELPEPTAPLTTPRPTGLVSRLIAPWRRQRPLPSPAARAVLEPTLDAPDVRLLREHGAPTLPPEPEPAGAPAAATDPTPPSDTQDHTPAPRPDTPDAAGPQDLPAALPSWLAPAADIPPAEPADAPSPIAGPPVPDGTADRPPPATDAGAAAPTDTPPVGPPAAADEPTVPAPELTSLSDLPDWSELLQAPPSALVPGADGPGAVADITEGFTSARPGAGADALPEPVTTAGSIAHGLAQPLADARGPGPEQAAGTAPEPEPDADAERAPDQGADDPVDATAAARASTVPAQVTPYLADVPDVADVPDASPPPAASPATGAIEAGAQTTPDHAPDGTDDPLPPTGIEPDADDATTAPPAPAAAPATTADPTAAADVLDDATSAPPRDWADTAAPEDDTPSWRQAAASVRLRDEPPTAPDGENRAAPWPDDTASAPEPLPRPAVELDLSLDEPSPAFLREAMRPPPPRRHPLWRTFGAVGVGVLGAAAVGQAALLWRDPLATQWPVLRPALQQLCALDGCRVDPLRHISALGIEHSALTRIEHSSLHRLELAVHNRGDTAARLPAIELNLTDAQGRLIARKVLPPDAFEQAADAAVPAGGELRLRGLLSTGGHNVDGYALDLFYP